MMENEIIVRESNALTRETADIVTQIINQSIMPIMDTMAKMIAQSNQLIQTIASQQEIQARQIQELQRQVSFSTPISRQQVKKLKELLKRQSTFLLANQNCTNKKAIAKLISIIRKDVKDKFTVGNIQDISKGEFEGAISFVQMWYKIQIVIDLAKEYRKVMECRKGD